MTRTITTVVGTLLAGLLAAWPAAASNPISPRSLVIQLPGFSTAEHRLESTTSAYRLAKVFFEDPPGEVPGDVRRLKREGFREGVREWFEYPHAGAEVDAEVFNSKRGAHSEFLSNVRFVRSKHFGPGFTDIAIPGSVGLTLLGPTRRVEDLLFTTGRCLFVLESGFEGSVSAEEARHPVIAGGRRLYARAKRICR